MKTKLLPTILIAGGLILLAMYFIPFGKATLKDSIQHAAYIMPSAYKVYSNPDALNGEYYLFKMLLTNTSKEEAQNVTVSYRIPNYIDWTDLQDIPIIYAGQNIVVKCYARFKDDIVEKMTQSQENVEIKITWNSGQSRTENFPVQIMGRNQFVWTDIPSEEISSLGDLEINDPLLACLVTPEDPIVKYYTQQVQEKVLKGEEAGVTQKPEDVANFLEGIYDATLLSHMVYSSSGGIPQQLGDVQSLIQNIRLPREVLTGNTGLCIELSLLYASILKDAGLHPVIFLIPGHAFPGVKLDDGNYIIIESTCIGGEGLGAIRTADYALKTGQKEFEDFAEKSQEGDPRYVLVNIDNLQSNGVVPMELKDDEFLRKKIDDITQNFGGGNSPPDNQRQNNTYASSNGGGGGAGGNSNSGSSVLSYNNGIINFNYPAGWVKQNNPIAQMPFYVSYIYTPDKTSEIDVFNFPGFANSNVAMAYVRQQAATLLGINIQYQAAGSSNGYFLYKGVSTSSIGTEGWMGVFKSTGNGIAGITVGGMNYNYAQMSPIYQSILSTVK